MGHIRHQFQFDLKQILFRINVVQDNFSGLRLKFMHFLVFWYKHQKEKKIKNISKFTHDTHCVKEESIKDLWSIGLSKLETC